LLAGHCQSFHIETFASRSAGFLFYGADMQDASEESFRASVTGMVHCHYMQLQKIQ
jgi:hypothetical protein